MCWATDVLRRAMGIHEYTPGMSGLPHALVRKPTRFGSRGNGHLTGLPPQPVDPLALDLARQHRTIRAMVADMRRTGGS